MAMVAIVMAGRIVIMVRVVSDRQAKQKGEERRKREGVRKGGEERRKREVRKVQRCKQICQVTKTV
jgi:hypothetical protein